MVVQGKFTGSYSVQRHGFLYDYVCQLCGTPISETAPELEEPIICHGCFTGTNRIVADGNKRRGELRQLPRSGRKGKPVEEDG